MRWKLLVAVLVGLTSLVLAAGAQGAPGDIDGSFGAGGMVHVPSLGTVYQFENVPDLAVGPAGETYVLRIGMNWNQVSCGGSGCADLLVSRYTPDGRLDRSFGAGGTAKVLGPLPSLELEGALTVDAEGRPIVAAGGDRIRVGRLERDGSPDPAFGSTPSPECDCTGPVAGVGIDAGDEVVVWGELSQWLPVGALPAEREGWVAYRVVHFRSDGQLEQGFGQDGEARVAVRGGYATGALQPGGGLLLEVEGTGGPVVRRVAASGRIDSRFHGNIAGALRRRGVSHPSAGLVVPRRGGGALAFASSFSRGAVHGYVVSLDSHGRVDFDFGRGGVGKLPGAASAVAKDPKGRVVGLTRSGEKTLIFRLGPNGTPDRTFAGGGAVVVPVQGASVAVGGGGARPTILDPGPRGIRNYLPPEPELLRLRGGTSRVRCGGKRATIVGTARGETLRGTSRADVIAGLGGRDEIHGGRGGDLICGGAGSDRLDGGPGRDRLHQ